MENRFDFSKIKEKDFISIAQELLNLTYRYNLIQDVSKNDKRPDLIYIVDSTKETEILVEVKGSRNISEGEAIQINNQILKYYNVFKPNKIILFCFSTIKSKVQSLLELTLQKLVNSNFEIIQLEWIERQLNEFPEVVSRFGIKINSVFLPPGNVNSNEQIIKLLSLNKQFFAAGHSWGNDDQFDRFINEGIWENGHDEKLQNVVNRAKQGDVIFLKSTFVQGGVGTLRIKAIGVILDNPRDGHLLHVNWQPIESIDLPGLGGTMSAINQIGFENAKRILEVLFKKLPDFSSIIDNLDKRRSTLEIETENSSVKYWWLNFSTQRWNFDDLKIDDSQLYFGLDEKDKEEIKDNLYKINIGDKVIAYQTGVTNKIKAILTINEKAAKPLLPRIGLKIINKIPIDNQVSFSELNELDYFKNSEVANNNNQGSIFQLSEFEYQNIISKTAVTKSLKLIKNELTKTGLDNDGAYTTKDLLDIENDVRSFALILASKNIKPPIAVALFGKWGSGKSFFMEQLSKRVDELSINQGFLEEGEAVLEPIESNEEADFCKGIAQIKFNAWSYLDANLWAGLVSSIFEKLDEYISNRSKGDQEKLELRMHLSNKLEILATEKKEVRNEIKSLENEKAVLKDDLNKLKSDKEELIRNIADKKLSEIIDAVIQKSNLKEGVDADLKKYGITQKKIDELSPAELYSEVNSWVTFFKNLTKFSATYVIAFFVAVLVLLFVWIDPLQMASNFFNQIGREITAAISIIGPLFAKVYSTFSKYKKLAEPITDYKNEFNKDLDEAKFEYEQEKSLLVIKMQSNQTAITQAESKIIELENQIEDLDYTLINFVAKRAFNNFIKRKVNDKGYNEHLGLISIIRKDFETLSDLFQDTLIDSKAPDEIQQAQKAKKEEHKNIVKLFKEEKVLDRIILYIDDLDRCSDDKVLEVIQAVHLLMAFPLFNVVVGVDKRCVNNALIYKNLLQYSQFASLNEVRETGIHVISPSEYLEKIFQIPFQLNDPSDSIIKKMVDSILKNQIEIELPADTISNEAQQLDETPSNLPSIKTQTLSVYTSGKKITEDKSDSDFQLETLENNSTETQEPIEVEKKTITIKPKDLKLTQEELDLLKEIMWLVGNVPRTIKRYINIYRIIRAHVDLNFDTNQKREEFLTVMFILAINIGQYKKHAEKLMTYIELDSDKDLGQFLLDNKELDEIRLKLEKQDSISEILLYKGSRFSKHILFVGRFSFGSIECSGNEKDKNKEQTQKAINA